MYLNLKIYKRVIITRMTGSLVVTLKLKIATAHTHTHTHTHKYVKNNSKKRSNSAILRNCFKISRKNN